MRERAEQGRMQDCVNVEQRGHAARGEEMGFSGLRWELRGLNVSKSVELLQT